MKKKANGQGSIRRRQDGRWEARYCFENKRYSVYGDTRAQCNRALTEALNDINNGQYIDQTSMTVSQWMDEWVQNIINVRPSTLKRYRQDIRLHINPIIGKIKLKDLTTMMLQRMYTTHKNEGLSPKTIHCIHGVVHEALQTAVNMDYLRSNVSDKCILPKIIRHEMHPIVDDDTSRFLDAIKNDDYHDIFYFTMFTGLRQSEALGLTWDCVDFKNKSIHIYRQLVRITNDDGSISYIFAPLKSDKQRVVNIASQVVDMLSDVYNKHIDSTTNHNDMYDNKMNLVFVKPDGSNLCHRTVYKRFKAIVTSIGKPQTRFHDLRHTFATLSIQNGSDIKTVSNALGHATTSFTLDRYGHVSESMRKDSADRMTSLIDSITKK